MKKLSAARILTLASILIACMTLPPVFGQSGSKRQTPPGGSPGEMPMQDIFNRLNLSAAQKQKIENIRNAANSRIRPLEQQMMSKQKELQAAFQGENFDQSLATRKLTEMAPIQAQLMGESFREHNEIMAVLTPQQKSQFQKLAQQAGLQPPESGPPASQ